MSDQVRSIGGNSINRGSVKKAGQACARSLRELGLQVGTFAGKNAYSTGPLMAEFSPLTADLQPHVGFM